MAVTRQIQVPGGAYVNEVTDSAEAQVPGYQYINEDTAAAAAGFDPINYVGPYSQSRGGGMVGNINV